MEDESGIDKLQSAEKQMVKIDEERDVARAAKTAIAPLQRASTRLKVQSRNGLTVLNSDLD
jgi:hypothetical protein